MNEREELERLRKLKRLRELEAKAGSTPVESVEEQPKPEPGFIESRVDAIKSIFDPETWKSIGHQLGPEGWEEVKKRQEAFKLLPEEEQKKRSKEMEAELTNIVTSFMPVTRMTQAGLKSMGATPEVVQATLKSGLEPVTKAIGKGLSSSTKVIGDFANLFLPKGAERILDKYQRTIVGEAARPKLTKALEQVDELVPGSKPTAAQALAAIPEGSPILAHQKIVAGTPGGVSGQFGQRILDQEAAREAAKVARETVTGPMRKAALDAANKSGGIESTGILQSIDDMAKKPGQRASDVVRKTIGSVKEKIESLASHTGKIDANDLYTVRKEIGNVIKTHSKETANFDKKLASGLQKDIQASIDDAIEESGGVGWKDYLAEYAKRSKAINEDISRAELAAKPVQKTSLQGGVNVAEETRGHIPQLLSRPAMLANALMRSLGKGIEPRVDQLSAERYLNPKLLAEVLAVKPGYSLDPVIQKLLEKEAKTQFLSRSILSNQGQ